MPVAVACVIDAMVCIYVGLFCSWGMEVLNWRQSFYVFMGMCAKITMFKSSVHGILIPHLNLVPSSSRSFYKNTKFEFQ